MIDTKKDARRKKIMSSVIEVVVIDSRGSSIRELFLESITNSMFHKLQVPVLVAK